MIIIGCLRIMSGHSIIYGKMRARPTRSHPASTGIMASDGSYTHLKELGKIYLKFTKG